jgi:putative flippase GtrA
MTERILSKRFIKFILVGFINTVFGYSVYALFIYLNMHYSLAVLFATILGVLFNFKSTGRLVFKVNNNASLARFIGVYVITYVLNVAALGIFNFYRFDLYVAGLLMILPMALAAYVLQSRYVFKEAIINVADFHHVAVLKRRKKR